jgi:hypothetical protein
MVKNETTCPARFPWILAKVTKAKFAAFNINSTHMKTTIAFLRTTTPIAPIVKRMAER